METLTMIFEDYVNINLRWASFWDDWSMYIERWQKLGQKSAPIFCVEL